jgi:Flp pilus assembly protein TadG
MVSGIAGLSRIRGSTAVRPRSVLSGARPGRRGSVAIQMGLLIIVLIGIAGLGTEIPFLMYKHRQMQTVADSAALGAAMALSKGYPSPIATEAYGIAAALGFANGSGNVTVTVNNPPRSGNYANNDNAVEVVVAQPQTLYLAGLFGVSTYNASARAVAVAGSGSGYCMLAMEPSSPSGGVGVGMWGGVKVTMSGCGMAVNTAGATALELNSGGTLSAPLVSIVGQLDNVWSTVNVTTLKQNQPAVADPYADIPMPASAGCDHNGFSIGYTANQTILNPGTYCDGLSISNGANVAFAPGVYIIKGGTLTMTGTPTNIAGTGVTFVLTENSCGCYSNVSVSGGVVATLSAPTSGPTAGILFFGDRNAPTSTSSSFSGFGTLNMTGAIYLPAHTLTYAGGGTISGCQQAIAWNINDYLNNLYFDGSCTGTGMKTIGVTSTLLVE